MTEQSAKDLINLFERIKYYQNEITALTQIKKESFSIVIENRNYSSRDIRSLSKMEIIDSEIRFCENKIKEIESRIEKTQIIHTL